MNKKLNILEFKTLRKSPYIFDNATGVVIPSSKELSYILHHYGDTKENIIAYLKDNMHVDEQYALSLYNYALSLIEKGFFFESFLMEEKNYNYDSIYNNASSQLILILTEACNMRCKYCIYSEHYPGVKSYSEKEMSIDTALKAVDFYMKIHQAKNRHGVYKKAMVSFYGGEPFLKFDVIKAVIEYCKEKKFDTGFNVTTNGTIMNDDIIKYLIDNEVIVGFSLDGPKDTHDRNRVLANGKPTFEHVFNSIKKLQIEKRNLNVKIPINISVTYDMNTNLENVVEFIDNNHDLFSPYDVIYNQVASYSTDYYDNCDITNSTLYKSIQKLTYKLFNDFTSNNTISYAFKNLYNSLVVIDYRQRCDNEQYRLCYPGGKFAISPNGEIYLCERVVQSCSIGNIKDGISLEKINKLYNDYVNIINHNCTECPVSRLCTVCFSHLVKNDSLEFSKEACEYSFKNAKASLKQSYSLLEISDKRFNTIFKNQNRS